MSEPDWVIESKLARKAGQLEEQERIIKLLEADGLNCDCDWCQISGDVPSQHHWRILRLIKEQQNG